MSNYQAILQIQKLMLMFFLLKAVSIPGSSTLEVFAGQKIIAQTTDIIKAQASTGSALDVSLSIMEIT